MGTVEIDDAEDELEAWLERAAAGEDILICRQGVPAARLIAMEKTSAEPHEWSENSQGQGCDNADDRSPGEPNDAAKGP